MCYSYICVFFFSNSMHIYISFVQHRMVLYNHVFFWLKKFSIVCLLLILFFFIHSTMRMSKIKTPQNHSHTYTSNASGIKGNENVDVINIKYADQWCRIENLFMSIIWPGVCVCVSVYKFSNVLTSITQHRQLCLFISIYTLFVLSILYYEFFEANTKTK